MENKKYQFNSESEIISKYIFEKLISLTINKVYTNKIFSKGNFSNYLFKYCRRIIDPIIKVNYINYDIDDLYKKNNTWNNVLEPGKIMKDVNLSNLILMNEQNNYNKTIKECIESNHKSTFRSNTGKSKSSIISKNNKHTINDYDSKKEKKLIKLNLPSYKIIDLDKNNEPSEIKLLREKIELELKEKKKKINESLENKLNKINKKLIKLNPIDSTKFTFDSNGNIILLKKINYQKLQKEFNSVNSKNTFIENIIPNEDEFYSYNIKNKDKIKVETVSAKIFPNEQKFSKKNMQIFQNFIKTKIKPVKQIEGRIKSICPPSGDNFELFEPHVGVNIRYKDNREKKGSVNYSKIFKRYSIGEFNDLYEKTLNLNKNIIKNNENDYFKSNSEDLIKNESLNLSSFIKNDNKKNNSQINIENRDYLYEKYLSKNYSSGHIICSQSVVNNSLFDTIDSLEYNPKFNKNVKNIKNEKIKDIFKNQLLNSKNINKSSKSIISRNKNKLYEDKSKDIIDKFNKSLVQDRGVLFELKNNYNNNKYSNSYIMPSIKPITKPEYNTLIKHNGTTIKNNLPLRIKFPNNKNKK